MKDNYMKNFISVVCVSALLIGCRSVNYPKVEQTYYGEQLPKLELIYNASVPEERFGVREKTQRINNYYANHFYSEVETNLMSNYGLEKGYLVLQVPKHTSDVCWGWYFLSLVTLTVPNILGMPLLSSTSEASLEAQIYDKNKQLIKTYTSNIEDTEYSALYWGYNAETWDGGSTTKQALVSSYDTALQDILSQIRNDIPFLKQQLK